MSQKPSQRGKQILKPKYVPKTKRISHMPDWAKKAIRHSQNPRADAEAMQVAMRVVREYGGPSALKRLLESFENSKFGHEIAKDFDVSKQRVSQWRKALGQVKENYVIRPVIKRALTSGFDA